MSLLRMLELEERGWTFKGPTTGDDELEVVADVGDADFVRHVEHLSIINRDASGIVAHWKINGEEFHVSTVDPGERDDVFSRDRFERLANGESLTVVLEADPTTEAYVKAHGKDVRIATDD